MYEYQRQEPPDPAQLGLSQWQGQIQAQTNLELEWFALPSSNDSFPASVSSPPKSVLGLA